MVLGNKCGKPKTIPALAMGLPMLAGARGGRGWRGWWGIDYRKGSAVVRYPALTVPLST